MDYFILKRMDSQQPQQFTYASGRVSADTPEDAFNEFLDTLDSTFKAGRYAVIEADSIHEFEVEPEFTISSRPTTDITQGYPAS